MRGERPGYKLKTRPKRITARLLRSIGACGTEVDGFKKLWPDGAPLNYKTVLTALRAELTPYFIFEEYLKFYGLITASQWNRFESRITRLDETREKAIGDVYDDDDDDDVESRNAKIAKIVDKARIAEAKLMSTLWKAAKREVWVFDAKRGE